MGAMDDMTLQHTITSYECGADLMLKPECFLLFCQEMAECHASQNGFGYDGAMAHGMIWVEVQGEFEFLRRPRWKEVVTLRTNTGKASPLQARRFVEMRDAEGCVIARADLMWVLIDIRTRRPMPLKRAEVSMPAECPPTIAQPLPPFPAEEAPTPAHSYLVTSRRDVDFNGHINNASYLTWALDSLPEAPGAAPRKIRIHYKRESHAGEALCICHQALGARSRHLITAGEETRAEILLEWEPQGE